MYNKWRPVQDENASSIFNRSWTLSTDDEPGWDTDSGCNGYGLSLELAQWICNILNQSGEDFMDLPND